MEEEDKKQFLMALSKTRVTLPGPNLTPQERAIQIEAFYEQLHQYPIGEIEAAFKRARGELRFFPSPVDILDFIREERRAQREEIGSRRAIEYKENPENPRIAPERFKELIDGLCKSLSGPSIPKKLPVKMKPRLALSEIPKFEPVLEGEEALKSEEKRRIAKEKIAKDLKLIVAK